MNVEGDFNVCYIESHKSGKGFLQDLDIEVFRPAYRHFQYYYYYYYYYYIISQYSWVETRKLNIVYFEQRTA